MSLFLVRNENARDSSLIDSLHLHDVAEDKAWKQNTVITFLARLIEKGMVKAARIGKANHYQPCMSRRHSR
ncbi:BlaI/MecI/CopY family transcriptional regulator [Brevibacillus massiliensis]|jgi:predicted transcriptional regulator|uniref:BlaI/MecI/CopY family transcriptional regulator n=1 Tax=Brevibacillus massiliensis TaxID=1118054 RepID=UPI0009DAE9DF